MVDLFNKCLEVKLKNIVGILRIGERGFRYDYVKKIEVKVIIYFLSYENKNVLRVVFVLKKRERSV